MRKRRLLFQHAQDVPFPILAAFDLVSITTFLDYDEDSSTDADGGRGRENESGPFSEN
jgi:hypothetical protein